MRCVDGFFVLERNDAEVSSPLDNESPHLILPIRLFPYFDRIPKHAFTPFEFDPTLPDSSLKMFGRFHLPQCTSALLLLRWQP